MTRIATFLLLLIGVSVLGPALAQDPQSSAEREPAENESSEAESSANGADTSDPAEGQVKTLSGMSILGNEEAPKSLVIVPWKSSELGDGISVNDIIDERARPVDKEVFLREVRYYQLRSRAIE